MTLAGAPCPVEARSRNRRPCRPLRSAPRSRLHAWDRERARSAGHRRGELSARRDGRAGGPRPSDGLMPLGCQAMVHREARRKPAVDRGRRAAVTESRRSGPRRASSAIVAFASVVRDPFARLETLASVVQFPRGPHRPQDRRGRGDRARHGGLARDGVGAGRAVSARGSATNRSGPVARMRLSLVAAR